MSRFVESKFWARLMNENGDSLGVTAMSVQVPPFAMGFDDVLDERILPLVDGVQFEPITGGAIVIVAEFRDLFVTRHPSSGKVGL